MDLPLHSLLSFSQQISIFTLFQYQESLLDEILILEKEMGIEILAI
jgi:hypothetical protein